MVPFQTGSPDLISFAPTNQTAFQQLPETHSIGPEMIRKKGQNDSSDFTLNCCVWNKATTFFPVTGSYKTPQDCTSQQDEATKEEEKNRSSCYSWVSNTHSFEKSLLASHLVCSRGSPELPEILNQENKIYLDPTVQKNTPKIYFWSKQIGVQSYLESFLQNRLIYNYENVCDKLDIGRNLSLSCQRLSSRSIWLQQINSSSVPLIFVFFPQVRASLSNNMADPGQDPNRNQDEPVAKKENERRPPVDNMASFGRLKTFGAPKTEYSYSKVFFAISLYLIFETPTGPTFMPNLARAKAAPVKQESTPDFQPQVTRQYREREKPIRTFKSKLEQPEDTSVVLPTFDENPIDFVPQKKQKKYSILLLLVPPDRL